MEFEDLVYQETRTAGHADVDVHRGADRSRDWASARGRSPRRATSAPATCKSTSGPLDLAIEGDGFFQIALPDGTTGYTRAGAFHLDAEGAIVTAEGYAVEPADHDSRRTRRRSASRRTASCRSSIAGQTGAQQLGTIELATFQNPAGLLALGGNLFTADDRVGRAARPACRHRRHRHDRAGLRRGLERQRRRGDGQHDSRAARLRGELASGQGRRRNARASQQHGAVARLMLLRCSRRRGVGPRRRPRSDAAVRAAIASAVQARVGADARRRGRPASRRGRLRACRARRRPDPSPARDSAVRRASGCAPPGGRVGYADRHCVHVTQPHVRLTRAVDARRATSRQRTCAQSSAIPGALLIEPLPGAAAVVGSTSVRRAVGRRSRHRPRIVAASRRRSAAATSSTTHVVVDGVEVSARRRRCRRAASATSSGWSTREPASACAAASPARPQSRCSMNRKVDRRLGGARARGRCGRRRRRGAGPTRAASKPAAATDNYDELYARYLQAARDDDAPARRPGHLVDDRPATDLRARRVNDLVTIRVVESITATGTADSSLDKASNGSASVTEAVRARRKLPGVVDPTTLVGASASTKFKGSGSDDAQRRPDRDRSRRAWSKCCRTATWSSKACARSTSTATGRSSC